MGKLIESGHLYTQATVTKYSKEAEEYLRNEMGIWEPKSHDYEAAGIKPLDSVEGPQPGNVLLTVGADQLMERLHAAEQVWDSTHGAIAVGDSTTAAAAGQSDLQAVTNKYYRVFDSTPTSPGSGQIIFVATFGTSVANFDWNEYGVVIPDTTTAYTSGTSKQASYIMLNRKAGAALLGTKTSAQSWVFTVTLTLA